MMHFGFGDNTQRRRATCAANRPMVFNNGSKQRKGCNEVQQQTRTNESKIETRQRESKETHEFGEKFLNDELKIAKCTRRKRHVVALLGIAERRDEKRRK